MDIDVIRPFLKLMYYEYKAVWAGQLSYEEFIKRRDLDEYEVFELEIPESLILFLYNKKTHKLYTRGRASVDTVIRVMRERLNDSVFEKVVQ